MIPLRNVASETDLIAMGIDDSPDREFKIVIERCCSVRDPPLVYKSKRDPRSHLPLHAYTWALIHM